MIDWLIDWLIRKDRKNRFFKDLQVRIKNIPLFNNFMIFCTYVVHNREKSAVKLPEAKVEFSYYEPI